MAAASSPQSLFLLPHCLRLLTASLSKVLPVSIEYSRCKEDIIGEREGVGRVLLRVRYISLSSILSFCHCLSHVIFFLSI